MQNPSMIFEILRVGGTAINAQNGVEPVVAENSRLLSRTVSVASENSFRTDFQAFLTQQIQPFAGEDVKHTRSWSATLYCGNIHTQQEG